MKGPHIEKKCTLSSFALSAGGPTEDRLQPTSTCSHSKLSSHVQQINPTCIVDRAVAVQLQLATRSRSFLAALTAWRTLADDLDQAVSVLPFP